MGDPFSVLGVSRNATESEIKKAYKELVKKYHPDKYSDEVSKELAEEKMSQINVAYDEAIRILRGGASTQNGAFSSSSYSGANSDIFIQVRQLIQFGNITEAERMLDNMDVSSRNAEWKFLKGSICFKRGWLNDAAGFYEQAANEDPTNQEYAQALNFMRRSGSGFMRGNPMNGGYRTSPNSGSCSGCDLCTGLICTDCCCEAMGGDFISCC